MKVKSKNKIAMREILLLAFIFSAYALVGTMDYEDAVLQHGVNCGSATYVLDNNLNCTGE